MWSNALNYFIAFICIHQDGSLNKQSETETKYTEFILVCMHIIWPICIQSSSQPAFTRNMKMKWKAAEFPMIPGLNVFLCADLTWLIIEFTDESPKLPLKPLILAAQLSEKRVDIDVNDCPPLTVDWVHCSIAVGAPPVQSFHVRMEFCFSSDLVCFENVLKWIHIGLKCKWTPKKCHILWDTGSPWDVCMGASPVGWNNQARGISWLSRRRGMAGRWFTLKETHSPLLRGLLIPAERHPAAKCRLGSPAAVHHCKWIIQ